jgi:hypothetical protein
MLITDTNIEDTSADNWREESPESRHTLLISEAQRIVANVWPPGTVMLLASREHVAECLEEIRELEATIARRELRILNMRHAVQTLAVFRKVLNDDQDILVGLEPGDPPRPNWAMRALQELDQIQGGGE